jgi:septation ring formation regulator EzrA
LSIELETLKSELERLKLAVRDLEVEVRDAEAKLKSLRQQELKARREVEALSTLIELQEGHLEKDDEKTR